MTCKCCHFAGATQPLVSSVYSKFIDCPQHIAQLNLSHVAPSELLVLFYQDWVILSVLSQHQETLPSRSRSVCLFLLYSSSSLSSLSTSLRASTHQCKKINESRFRQLSCPTYLFYRSGTRRCANNPGNSRVRTGQDSWLSRTWGMFDCWLPRSEACWLLIS